MRQLLLFTLSILLFSQSLVAQLITPATKPNKTQELLIMRGYGMFVHFGVNTFTDMEWSNGKTPASVYNPTNLDCDQWVRVAKEAGFRYVLLVTKHCDGFCLWDSKFTEYDVASSPVKTDVVAEVSKACKKYGLQFGVYYSLWDRNQPSFRDKDKTKYVDYMINQLTELFSNYGSICELWLDAGWERKPADWEIDRVYKTIKKLQPHCAFGVNHTIVVEPNSRVKALPDSMVVDNKYFFQYFPGDFRLWDPKIAHLSDKKQYMQNGQSYYMPFEHTICLSHRWNWFQKKDIIPVRALEELEELFYWCTANDNSLVVNVPPDNTGQLREHEANTIIGLGKRLNIKKNKPLPKNGKFISINAPIVASSILNNDELKFGARWAIDGGMQTAWAAADTIAELVLDLDQNQPFNKISIFENQIIKVAKDQFTTYRTNRILSYCIDCWLDNAWKTIYMSEEPMGDCKVIRFPKAYKTSKLRFKVLKASAPPSITELNVIYMNN